jgi:hypothetical protein
VKGPGTPIVSFGPLTLVVAIFIVPAIEFYERVRRRRDELKAEEERQKARRRW